jgi:hypothetical protein
MPFIQLVPSLPNRSRPTLRASRGPRAAIVPGILGKRQRICRGSWVPTDLVCGLKAAGQTGHN